jgi:hypothetical protein
MANHCSLLTLTIETNQCQQKKRTQSKVAVVALVLLETDHLGLYFSENV